ncbi:OB-fold domain-containing protein [Mesorhizobium sp.]|uniref:Zn-ribbon domain-containing OB-fold protein n=1 Tax=Mesorhizobium sp. TaxID=1871066 RepID=UPI000FE87C6A|nr:OB-fold domain-containing protein [Mesorhizobium sp.]RWB70004.1 MAG: hypothetical protein EOQ49_19310 [Mesorhizobium sp.]
MEHQAIIPIHNEVSAVWFEAIEQGKLLLQRDPVTGKAQYFPRPHVLGAPGRKPEWFEASGRGKIYTYTVVKRSLHPEFVKRTPFTLAIVELEEGPRMTTWIVDVPDEELECDMAVKVVFREIHPGVTMPCFTRA